MRPVRVETYMAEKKGFNQGKANISLLLYSCLEQTQPRPQCFSGNKKAVLTAVSKEIRR